ncbi:MAG: hypothetical protein RMM08_01720 [Armatimonadota bacterium]|nr:hypothetical protein [bacterium]MDW8320056.1 hypothetical protein [Armatimonadota bacterium]
MGRDITLQRVEEDIAAGNLGRARDRLHGLVWQYPDDLSLRCRLAEVYWQLGFPAMAGCYWYLEEPVTPAMQQAHAEFERSCGKDPLCILFRLKFRGNIETLPEYARLRLKGLQEECERKHGRYPVFVAKRREWRSSGTVHRQNLENLGCLLLLLAVLALAIIGFGTVLSRVIQWWNR